jgi:putative nucleotidyltransferase with HDIG domain
MLKITAVRERELTDKIISETSVLAEYRVMSRLSLYIVILAWIVLGIYLYAVTARETATIFHYFLSTDQLGIKFRALILLAPLILTAISYLINDRARLLLKSLSAERDVRTLCDDLIVAFANAIDAKSHWTNGHSERVTSYALSIAKEMGVSESERRTLKIASLLHDIGKIGTYDVILDKPGPLTSEEWQLIKMHPTQGENILRPIKQFQDVIPIIKCHHERVDGKGYPNGLRGDELPLLAKILCLADSYDAMVADRPYKKGLDKENAFSEIRQKTGTQFDPDIVRAFFTAVE